MGVEILRSLHADALSVQRLWNGDSVGEPVEGALDVVSPSANALGVHAGLSVEQRAVQVEFRCGDACGKHAAVDWSDADVVLVNNASLTLLERIAATAMRLKPGSIVITTFNPLPSYHFRLLDVTEIEMAGGVHAKLFIQRRMQSRSDVVLAEADGAGQLSGAHIVQSTDHTHGGVFAAKHKDSVVRHFARVAAEYGGSSDDNEGQSGVEVFGAEHVLTFIDETTKDGVDNALVLDVGCGCGALDVWLLEQR
jgi:hypothetical protein